MQLKATKAVTEVTLSLTREEAEKLIACLEAVEFTDENVNFAYDLADELGQTIGLVEAAATVSG